MKQRKRKILLTLGGVLITVLIVLAFLPSPIEVETAVIQRGYLSLTVDEDGMTRIKDHFVVSMPLVGRVMRIELEPGDSIEAGKTVLAVVEPGDPQLLDTRSRAQAEARVKGAGAAYEQSQAQLTRASEDHAFANSQYRRAEDMFHNKIISQQEYDEAEYRERSTAEALRASRFAVTVSQFELEQASAALQHTNPDDIISAENPRLEIVSPIDGRILNRFQESSAVLPTGAPLLELGDPVNLEVVIDVLSQDAVKIQPGARALIEHWGGSDPLEARIRRVEPAAFTKISALGVEEQRVWVIADFITPPEERSSLGDAYRIESRVFIWENDDVLKVPASALFRIGDDWAVYVVKNNRAVARRIGLEQNNGLEAEIVHGLTEGEVVILYPSDRIEDGVRIHAQPDSHN